MLMPVSPKPTPLRSRSRIPLRPLPKPGAPRALFGARSNSWARLLPLRSSLSDCRVGRWFSNPTSPLVPRSGERGLLLLLPILDDTQSATFSRLSILFDFWLRSWHGDLGGDIKSTNCESRRESEREGEPSPRRRDLPRSRPLGVWMMD
jgi:hypothetical protein